jgi:hypothetical protein
VNLTNGYNFIADQLDLDGTGTNNTLTTMVGVMDVPSGTEVYVWDVTNQVFLPPSTLANGATYWNPDYNVPIGKGFVMWANTSWIVTFVGQVRQGNLINFVAGSNKLSLLAGMDPIGSMALSGSTNWGFPGTDGDNCFLFNNASQSYSDAFTYFCGFGWFDPDHAAGTNGPIIAISQPFFVQNPGPDTNWVYNFVIDPPVQNQMATKSIAAAPGLGQIRASGGMVTLDVINKASAPYSVQFSTDGMVWSTVATNQTGAQWTGKMPAGARGFYQVVNQ